MTNPAPLRLSEPIDLDDARAAARRLVEMRREAEQQYRDALKDAALKEREFRLTFSREFTKAEGTAAERESKARAEAADAGYERDLATGLVKATSERIAGIDAQRSMLKTLAEWSMRLSLDGQADGPGPTFGGRA